MRIVTVTMARNEGDIVEAFVRHHLPWVDHMIILDHDSTDSTPAILRELVREGLPLTVQANHSLLFQQGPMTTSLARRAFAEFGADFVLPIDADEFLRAPSRSALEAALAAIPAARMGRVSWQNYLCHEADDPQVLNPVARMQHRARQEVSPQHKVVLTPAFAAARECALSPGNHHVLLDARGGRSVETVALEALALAHFALRSQSQMQQKILLGWLSTRLQNPVELPAHAAPNRQSLFRHWHEMFGQLLRNPEIDTATRQRLAWQHYVGGGAAGAATTQIDLVVDPLPVAYDLRYTDRASSDALTSLARWTDALLTVIGQQMR